MRTHPQSIEVALRVLKKICEAPDSTTAERFRACELILAAHGRLVLDAERTPKHNGLKGLISARLELSAVDKGMARQMREDRKKQAAKLKEELQKI